MASFNDEKKCFFRFKSLAKSYLVEQIDYQERGIDEIRDKLNYMSIEHGNGKIIGKSAVSEYLNDVESSTSCASYFKYLAAVEIDYREFMWGFFNNYHELILKYAFNLPEIKEILDNLCPSDFDVMHIKAELDDLFDNKSELINRRMAFALHLEITNFGDNLNFGINFDEMGTSYAYKLIKVCNALGKDYKIFDLKFSLEYFIVTALFIKSRKFKDFNVNLF